MTDANDSEPPSDPEGLDYGRLDNTQARADFMRQMREMRADVRELLRESAESRGSARTWRVVGGLAATLAITLGGAALALGAQASSDHDRVSRHETLIDDVRDDIEEINRGVARIEGRLGQPRDEE